jgi:hypothetical protein
MMMRVMRVLFGVLFVGAGLLGLIVVLRQGGMNEGQAMIGPLALMGAGALSISSARKRKP